MARTNPKMTVDIEFGAIDEKKVKELGKRISSEFRTASVDPKWMETEKKLISIQKDHSKAQEKSLDLAEKKNDLNQKEFELQNKLNDIERQRQKNIDNTKASHEKFEKLKVKDAKSTKDFEEENKNSKKEFLKLNKQQDKIETALLENKLKHGDLDIEQTKNGIELNDILLNQLDIQEKYNKMSASRLEMQNELIAILEKEKKLTHEQAVEQAKKVFPIDKKQSDLEKKNFELLKKTRKFKKEDLKDLKVQSRLLKEQGIGKAWWDVRGKLERRNIIGQEKKRLLHDKGQNVPLAEKAKMGAKAAGGEVAGQGMQLAAALGGPLIALASIAGFVMGMLNVNKKIVEGQKAIVSYGATGSETFKNLGKLSEEEMTGILSQSEAYRSSLRGLYGDIGMKYEEALKATEELTKAGVTLDIRSKESRTDFKDYIKKVSAAAVISGETFGEAATQAGELTTEFRKSKNEVFDTFATMKQGASEAGVMTSRFYSSVMNAAQGLAIYGTDVNDVSNAFRDLTKNLKMPQKQASELATQMLNNVNSMTSAQKLMVAQKGGAQELIEAEKANIQKEIASGKLSGEQLKTQTKRLENINDVLGNLQDPGSWARMFEELSPGQKINTQIKSLVSLAPQVFKDVIDESGNMIPDKLAKAIKSNRHFILENLSPTIGIAPEQLRLIEQFSEAGTRPEDIGKGMQAAQDDAFKKQMKEQAHVVEMGTRDALGGIGEWIGGTLEKIYNFVMNTIWPWMQNIGNLIAGWMGEDVKLKNKASNALLGELAKTKQEETDLLKREKELSGKNTPEAKAELKAIAGKRTSLLDRKKKLEEGIAASGAVNKTFGQKAMSGITGKAISGVTGIETTESKQARTAQQALWDVKQTKFNELLENMRAKSVDSDTESLAQDTFDSLKKNWWFDETGKMPYEKEMGKVRREGFLKYGSYQQANEEQIKGLFSQLGFMKGGYTGSGDPRRPAGIVHGGEFVFDKDSTMKAGANNLQQLMSALKTNRAMPNVNSINSQSVINAIDNLNKNITAVAERPANTNYVTLNINQRDRQEIEQIIYKVLYNEKPVGA